MPLWLLVILFILALNTLWCLSIYKNRPEFTGETFKTAAIIIILIATILMISGILAGKFLL